MSKITTAILISKLPQSSIINEEQKAINPVKKDTSITIRPAAKGRATLINEKTSETKSETRQKHAYEMLIKRLQTRIEKYSVDPVKSQF